MDMQCLVISRYWMKNMDRSKGVRLDWRHWAEASASGVYNGLMVGDIVEVVLI